MDFRKEIQSDKYNFLRETEQLSNNIILLGVSGSYGYGINNENSDLDLRGIATRSKRDILTGKDFEQIVDTATDTTIYSFNKIIKLLCSCNPNVIELLGLKDEHYLYLSEIGKELLKNKSLFLSKKAINSFGGYADNQARRLCNKAAVKLSDEEKEKHIINSINRALINFNGKHKKVESDNISLYVDKSEKKNFEDEIYMNLSLSHYPVIDYSDLLVDMNNVIKSFDSVGFRNKKAIEHNKLGKHMAHTIRLYLMAFDILEKGEIITYRENEKDLLVEIRNGKYLDENSQPTKEFILILNEYEYKLDHLAKTTHLPDDVDTKKINDFVYMVNEKICDGDVQ